MVTPCKGHVELGDKFLSMLLPAELCWCWIIMLGCNWRLKFFINGKLLNRSVEWQVFDKQHHHNIIFTFATTSHYQLTVISPLFSPGWGPSLFRQIKLLFCRIEKEILNMLNKSGQHWAADWKHYSRSAVVKFVLIPRSYLPSKTKS